MSAGYITDDAAGTLAGRPRAARSVPIGPRSVCVLWSSSTGPPTTAACDDGCVCDSVY